MPGSLPAFVCPRCHGSLAGGGERSEREEGYRCEACGSDYPVVAGIPDFRFSGGPWLDIHEDREKARRLDEMLGEAGLEEALRAYWSITPGTPGEQAGRFVRHCLRAGERSSEWLERLERSNAGARGEPWLDLGCGTADLAAAAGARGRATAAVDVALRWLVVARRRPGTEQGGVRLVCARAEALPFPDASFGAALSLGLLAHVPDPKPVFSEARRVLAPRGRLALRTVNRYTLLREPHVGVWGVGFLPRRWADAYVRWRTERGYRHHRPLSPRELRRALARAGFGDVCVEAALTLDAEAGSLGGTARRLLPLYEKARETPVLRGLARWTAPLLEARGRRP